MTQVVDIVCDRCGKTIKGSADDGAGPHWDLAFHSMTRPVKGKKGWTNFDSLSWDVCEDCAIVVGRVLTEQAGLKPRDAAWQKPARERLGL